MSQATNPTEIVDRVEDELRGRTSQEEAITSSELSEQLQIGDCEGNPHTRELVREVMQERGLPVIAGSSGYWVATTKKEIEEYTQQLDARIQGIQNRKYQIIAAWNRSDPDE